MTNPSNLVITGLDGYFILNFLQKSGYIYTNITSLYFETNGNISVEQKRKRRYNR